jgi:hypothetical protein
VIAGSAGVPPAKPLESMPRSFFIHAGETPALPGVGQPLKPYATMQSRLADVSETATLIIDKFMSVAL